MDIYFLVSKTLVSQVSKTLAIHNQMILCLRRYFDEVV